MSYHAPKSPSSWGILNDCALYGPHGESNPSSDEGNRGHEAKATGNYAGISGDLLDAVLQTDEYESAFIIGADHVDREIRLEIALGNYHSFGTVDCLIRRGSKGHVIDYKFGRGYVASAEENLQGKGYVIGSFDKHSELEEITLHFIIPRRNEVTSHTFHRSELEELRAEIITLLDRVYSPDAKPHAGSYCNWCVHQSTCSETLGKALIMAEKLEIKIPDNADPEIMTPETLGTMALPLAKALKGWIASVEKRATGMAKDGVEIPGHKLMSRKKPAKFENSIHLYDDISHLIDQDIFIACSKPLLGELEKAVWATAPESQRDQAVEEFRTAVEENNLNQGEETTYLGPLSRKDNASD